MTKFPRFERFWRWTAAMLAGGSMFALDSCDPEVKSTILTGLQGVTTDLATTFIDAFFLKLQQSDDTTTAMLRVADEFMHMLA